ncbi:non-homologous end joining protein Ku [Streptomyces tsukubensis]|uniref:Non-homologous end joining protein Ku n=1 Tax=Streptomyces tsukubensis TaxID=83656 RepID=A0A1V4AEH2_9ACTN|nr:Ku protein [Streptomyces tsukubensis]OON81883.1 Ku protein [Streptomyces tsukubensis]QFR96672.1 Ku protein [Streptomyces tsukubensis]
MPRPVWSGAISFGLVTIPIKVVPATAGHDIHFHRVHLEDSGRIRNRRFCELENKEVEPDEIGKGYEISRDRIVPVSDDDLAGMPLPTAKAMEIAAFVPEDSIDPIRMSAGYYLQADGQVASKPYVLLRRALERSSKVAIAKYAWSGRERLGMLRVQGDVILLHALKWDDEVRSPDELRPAPVDISDTEIDQAMTLMDSMETDDLDQYHDEYREAVERMIEAKAEGKEPPKSAGEEREEHGDVVDLMSALQDSVRKAEASRSADDGDGGGEDATVHEMPKRKAAKESPGTKAAAKKSATAKRSATAKKTSTGKKSTAKKSTAKKTAGRNAKSA